MIQDSISVLMSVYKNDNPVYFNEAMESIWDNQTVKPAQIILVQDGSVSEELKKIIHFWKEKLNDKLIIHKNEVNIGLTKSLNIALKYATYDYIARMDSDDISHPKRFEKQIDYLEKHPEIDILGGSIEEINQKGESLNVRFYPLNSDACRKYIRKASPLAHPTVMIRKKVFDYGLCYNELYRTSQDIALWFDALLSGFNISNIEDVTLYFRITEDTFQRRNRHKAINEFKIYMKGIRKMNGFTLAYMYPLSRVSFRLLPTFIVKKIYNSKIRNKVLQKSKK